MTDRNIIYSPDARKQIKAISTFTRKTWGANQQLRYMSQLYAAADLIRQYPDRGKPRDELSVGLLSYRVGKHVLFYRVEPETVTIVAVLHEKMDPTRHL
jgi:toxin ParE1/3/4